MYLPKLTVRKENGIDVISQHFGLMSNGLRIGFRPQEDLRGNGEVTGMHGFFEGFQGIVQRMVKDSGGKGNGFYRSAQGDRRGVAY